MANDSLRDEAYSSITGCQQLGRPASDRLFDAVSASLRAGPRVHIRLVIPRALGLIDQLHPGRLSRLEALQLIELVVRDLIGFSDPS